MGKRTTGRRLAMQALYEADVAGKDIKEAVDDVLKSEEGFHQETKEFARQIAFGAWKKREDIDKDIARLSIGWPLDRIGMVDKSILRLAMYEIEKEKTPHSVVINEAVELAKKYSGAEAAKFINGILGAFIKS